MDLKADLDPSHFQELEEIKRGTLFEDVPLWLWSPIISEQECSQVAETAEALGRRLCEIGLEQRRLGQEERWLPNLPHLLESVRSDPASTDPAFHWRLDFLWDRAQKTMWFLELNAGDPSGLGWVSAFTEAMRGHSLWREPLANRLRTFDLAGSHRGALEQVLGGRSGTVGFAAASESTVRSDIECWAQQFRSAGWNAEVADPLEYEVRDDGLYRGESKIAALIRDTYEELYWPPYQGVGERLAKLVREGKLLLLNPLCATFWDSKALWSELKDWPTVPFTQRLSGPVDHPTDWVLKPVLDYGGRGVICGSQVTRSRWEDAIDKAMLSPDDWILQRAAPFSTGDFPFLKAGDIVWEERFLTWSVFLDRLHFAGMLARAGSGPVVNVHNGGAIFPVYVDTARP